MIRNLIFSNLGASLLGGALILFVPPAEAAIPKTISGIAVVEDSMALKINGQQISLWGINTLAPDQQCWQEGSSWTCGEDALIALKHFVDGRLVTCEIQQQADKDGPATGKCTRMKGQVQYDISKHIVTHGWALDRSTASDGIYYADEQEAQKSKRGVWSGRFQTAQDWKEGIQRFVGEDEHPTAEDKAEPDGE